MKLLKLFIPVFVALFLILTDYKFSTLNQVRQTLGTLVSPVYLLASLPAQLFTWIDEQGTSKNKLLNTNQNLRDTLLKLQVELQKFNTLKLENQKLTRLLDVKYTSQQDNFTLAKITSTHLSRVKKQLLINKGSANGIQMGDVVLGVDGIIGQISSVSTAYAHVLMISDPTQFVPVKNTRNNVYGISKGMASKKDTLNINFVAIDADVKLGDIFISSAIGTKFPSGYPLGKVILVEKKTNTDFLKIQLKPIQTTRHLEFVIVANSL
jgi:rod shape-determining protein MreC